jgi:hypothetical protein
MENRVGGGGTKGRRQRHDGVGEAREGAARKSTMEGKVMRFGMIERQEWTTRFGKQSHGEAGRRQSHGRVKPRERMVLPTKFVLLFILFSSRDRDDSLVLNPT